MKLKFQSREKEVYTTEIRSVWKQKERVDLGDVEKGHIKFTAIRMGMGFVNVGVDELRSVYYVKI